LNLEAKVARGFSYRSKIVLAFALFIPVVTASQTPDAPAVTIRVQSSLVLVDLISQDGKTALPLTGLKQDNFQLFDNGVEMPVETFDSGARYSTRPISLWLVGICNQIDWDENGS
jgi:hypothetical protein